MLPLPLKSVDLWILTQIFYSQSHHPIVRRFGRKYASLMRAGKGILPKDDELIDFLGVRTYWKYDCCGGDKEVFGQCKRKGGYLKFVPSRRQACSEYFSRQKQLEQTEWPEAGRGFPDIDDEYPELVSLLHEIYQSDGRFSFMEIGARYGTWLTRAALAFRMVFPKGKFHGVAVESQKKWHSAMVEHVKRNGIGSDPNFDANVKLKNIMVNTVDDIERILKPQKVGLNN